MCLVEDALWVAQDGYIDLLDVCSGQVRTRIQAETLLDTLTSPFYVNAITRHFDRVWVGSSDGVLRSYSLRGDDHRIWMGARPHVAGIKCLAACDGGYAKAPFPTNYGRARKMSAAKSEKADRADSPRPTSLTSLPLPLPLPSHSHSVSSTAVTALCDGATASYSSGHAPPLPLPLPLPPSALPLPLPQEVAEGHPSFIRHLWSASDDSSIVRHDLMDESSIKVFAGHNNWVRALLPLRVTYASAVGRQGQEHEAQAQAQAQDRGYRVQVWSAADDGIRVWTENGVLVCVLRGHGNGQRVLCLAQVYDTVWSGGADKYICVWSIKERKLLKKWDSLHSSVCSCFLLHT